LVLWEKVAEFGRPGSTEKIGIFRFFDDFMRILPKVFGFLVILSLSKTYKSLKTQFF
jgi:hypothetical protein